MKALVVGQGGREHAIVKALAMSPLISGIHAIPGSHGMAGEAICHKIDLNDYQGLIEFCKRTEINFVIIGPEDPLVSGLADLLRAAGILVVGPNKKAAQLEGSKVFAKQFMTQSGVATSRYVVVSSVEDVMRKCNLFKPPFVFKVDGLAAGKGVYICKTVEELKNAAIDTFETKLFGIQGDRAIIEEFLPGTELSVLILTNGQDYEILPLAQDHKQLFDQDQGPNTGGMGTIAPMEIPDLILNQIKEKVIDPTLIGLEKEDLLFRGVIFFGIMVTQNGPMCLEYNVRFGDPETQVILPLLDGDWAQVFFDLANGNVNPLKWNSKHACCVILAAKGYPNAPLKGAEIKGDLLKCKADQYFVHAGTLKSQEGFWSVNGGRVLGAVGIGKSKDEAIHLAYDQAGWASWEGQQIRRDIGSRQNIVLIN